MVGHVWLPSPNINLDFYRHMYLGFVQLPVTVSKQLYYITMFEQGLY